MACRKSVEKCYLHRSVYRIHNHTHMAWHGMCARFCANSISLQVLYYLECIKRRVCVWVVVIVYFNFKLIPFMVVKWWLLNWCEFVSLLFLATIYNTFQSIFHKKELYIHNPHSTLIVWDDILISIARTFRLLLIFFFQINQRNTHS